MASFILFYRIMESNRNSEYRTRKFSLNIEHSKAPAPCQIFCVDKFLQIFRFIGNRASEITEAFLQLKLKNN